MDLKTTLLSRPLVQIQVKMTKNQLLSRPLQIELKTLTLITWSPLMRQAKSFQILRWGRRHNQWQNSHPVVHHQQDQGSTPSMRSQDPCPLTVPGIFKHCSPTALTALETWRVSMTSRQTPTVPPVQHRRQKVPHQVQGGDQEGASRDGPARNHHQTDWAHTMGQQPDIPQKRQMASWGYALTPRTWTRQSSMRTTRPQPSRR